MSGLLAQIADAAGTLEQLKPYGIGGVVVAFMLAREVWKDARDAKREDKRNEERDKLWNQLLAGINQNTVAIGHLIRATTADVLSRPGVDKRVRDEMEETDRVMERMTRTLDTTK